MSYTKYYPDGSYVVVSQDGPWTTRQKFFPLDYWPGVGQLDRKAAQMIAENLARRRRCGFKKVNAALR